MDNDLVLLERWRGGDQQAGQELFRRHFADIYRFFEHKVGAEAEDLAQRTFLACIAARDQFKSQSSFRTYLFSIARHEFYGHLRRQRAGEQVDFEVTSVAEILPSPASALDRARQLGRLREALRELPAEQQLLLELHYWHDLDALALTEVFGVPAGTIRVRLLRARQALREQMNRIGSESLANLASDRLAASLLDT